MKKRPHRFLSLLLATAVAWGAISPMSATVAEAAGTISSMNLIWQTPIGEGTTLYKYTKPFGDKKASVFVTKVDLTNPYVEVKPVYGTNSRLTEKQTVTKMAQETNAVAAVNADFFNMTKRGAPFGIVMKDKEIVSSMGHLNYWYSLGITSDKTAAIQKFGFTGKVTAQSGVSYSLRGVNKEEYNPTVGKSHVNQLNLYTPKFGKTSLGTIPNYKNVVEVVVVDNVATQVRIDQPGAPIPHNGYVLWGNGQAAQFLLQQVPVGSTVSVEMATTPTDQDWEQAVGGHLLLVDKGVPLTNFTTDSYITGPNARTAVGTSQDGKTLYIVTVDDSWESRGVSLVELAKIMAEIGCYRAANFDGGGSTTLAARMLGETQAKLINTPKGGAERRVPTGLAVYNTAPPGTLAGFQIIGASEVLIGQTVQYSTKAYDNHYLPYVIQPHEITWEVGQSGAGSFDGNRFTALKSGTTTLVARANGISQTRSINVYGGKDIQQIIVSPAPINMAPNQTLTLDVKVKTKKGQVIQATPLSVTASVDSSVVSVNDKLQVTASDKSGKANLTIAYDGVTTTIPVNVGEFEQPWLTFDNQTGMHFFGNPDTLKGSFTAVSGSHEQVFRSQKAAKLSYDFSNAADTDIRIAYGRVGSKPASIPGNPYGIGVWVYGDNSKHWLRAEVLDSKGKVHFVDLAKEIDWTGWKQVKGFFPAAASYPLQLRSLYVVNKPEDTSSRPVKGTLYFDELSLLLPFDPANIPAGTDVKPTVPGRISLGYELDLGYSFAAAASFLEKARIETSSNVNKQLPGYVTADYSFTIKPVALKPGKQDELATTPVTLTLIPKKWVKSKGIGLLHVNQQTGAVETLYGQMDAKRNWIYKVNAYGTYIPYYLEKPGDTPFLDMINHPAKEEVNYMAAKGIVKGLEADLFGPEVSLTRAQFVTLLARANGWSLASKQQLAFRDAIPEYARGAVQEALARGLVKGYPDKTFRPDQPVTRAEAAAILDRLLKKKGQLATPIADKNAWPSWAASSIANVAGLGLMEPIDNKFLPAQAATRAVFVVALYRMEKM